MFGAKRTTSARAVVLRRKESTWLQGGSNLGPSSGMKWASLRDRVSVRVEPESGAPFESVCHVTSASNREHRPSAGDETYVLYDPSDSGKCVIDRERLQREFPGLKQWTIPDWVVQEQRHGPSPPPVPYGSKPDRLDELAKLGELHANGVLTDAEFAAEKAKVLSEG